MQDFERQKKRYPLTLFDTRKEINEEITKNISLVMKKPLYT